MRGLVAPRFVTRKWQLGRQSDITQVRHTTYRLSFAMSSSFDMYGEDSPSNQRPTHGGRMQHACPLHPIPPQVLRRQDSLIALVTQASRDS